MTERYVAIDLDGTLAEYNGWKGLDHIGEPKPHARSALEAVKEETDLKIIIYTCRAENGLKRVRDWLEENSIPYDHINFNPEQPETAGKRKIWANYYIDDRNVNFHNLLESISNLIKLENNR